MKETNEKVYRCDFCNRAMVSKGFMVLHERMCKRNSNNQHQCFKYCQFLTKDEVIKHYAEDGEQYDIIGECSFYCEAKPDSEGMYSYKLERYKKNKHRIKSLIRMPLKCDLYKCMGGHDFSDTERDYGDSIDYIGKW